MRIVHIITGLGQGGAEAVLYRLATYAETTTRHVVISLTDEGVYGARLRAAGIKVHALGMARGRVTLGGLMALRALLRKEAPDAVQTWMYHADLIGGLAARLAGIKALSWGIRNSGNHLNRSSRSARLVLRLCALLSGWMPRAIVCAAQDAADRHQALGYDTGKIVVIANGYDLSRYAPDPLAGERMRALWGVDAGTPLIGCVARWDPLKDHRNLLAALGQLLREGQAPRCVLVGRGMTPANAELMALIDGQGLAGQVLLAGPSDDVPAVMNSLDLHVLSSCAEGFPNVVAEAMACGTPCVVTDVGDAAYIVGDTGVVVPPEQPAALARGIAQGLREMPAGGRAAEAARERVLALFDLGRMVRAYEAVWRRIAGDRV
ncbi:glycosyltransferase family 4 protein [Bordetella avium]|uniref:glycosyltransferase family 4 protein n=1 Tax=Bordetella avium TaxID=521 RepID=UPI000E68DEC2|nr:glycosyltransferase [Bordetella avium]AZY51465.1 glycosyl transferase [Bordetella avium]RIQ71966.1 glycosyltransferase [Bordetella avium]